MVKNVIVFGAHGNIGKHLMKLLGNSSYKATAVVRNEDQASTIKSITGNANVSTTQLLLDDVSVDDLAKAINGHDAVVFTAGSGGKNLLRIDLDAAVKTFEAAVKANSKRYILISALHADRREFIDSSQIRDYYIAKHYADRILINEFKEVLDFTILKPTRLTNGEGKEKFRLVKDINDDSGSVDRIDVAKVIFNILDASSTFGKSYDFANGDKDLSEVFK